MRVTASTTHRLAPGALALLLLTGGGCGTPQKRPPAPRQPVDTKADLPGEVDGKGWHIPWRMRDPNNPHGPSLPVVTADARFGTLKDNGNTFSVVLREVHARLFKSGRPTANLEAAQVTANARERILIGTGGVKITSLTDPPDTVVTADKISWNTRTSTLVAVGHAHLLRLPRHGGTFFEHRGGRLTFDTALRTFTFGP